MEGQQKPRSRLLEHFPFSRATRPPRPLPTCLELLSTVYFAITHSAPRDMAAIAAAAPGKPVSAPGPVDSKAVSKRLQVRKEFELGGA